MQLVTLFCQGVDNRKKGDSQNGGNKKTKHAKLSEKMNISYPPVTHRYVCISWGTKYSFSGKHDVPSFLATSVLSKSMALKMSKTDII